MYGQCFSISSSAACPFYTGKIYTYMYVTYLPLSCIYMRILFSTFANDNHHRTILIHFVLYIIFIVEVKVNLLSTFLMTFNSYTKRARLVIDNTWQMYLWVSSCGKHDTQYIYSHIAIMYSYKFKKKTCTKKKRRTEWKWKYIERNELKILSSSFSH